MGTKHRTVSASINCGLSPTFPVQKRASNTPTFQPGTMTSISGNNLTTISDEDHRNRRE